MFVFSWFEKFWDAILLALVCQPYIGRLTPPLVVSLLFLLSNAASESILAMRNISLDSIVFRNESLVIGIFLYSSSLFASNSLECLKYQSWFSWGTSKAPATRPVSFPSSLAFASFSITHSWAWSGSSSGSSIKSPEKSLFDSLP